MVSTFTPNIQLEQPARGDDVGVWDTPVNNNSGLTDLVLGAVTGIALNNSPVTLSAAQFQSKSLTFNSTLTGSVVITFPTSFKKSYEIYNACSGSSTFTITLQTTASGAGAQVICAPPGQTVTVSNDGANVRFVNFGGPIGTYLDYAGSSSPNWNDGCTIKPYLNCDGTTFSSGTFPILSTILGGTTLPDARGRSAITLNQGTARTLSSGAGVDGNTLLAAGGNNGVLLSTSQVPTIVAVNAAQSVTVTLTGGFTVPGVTGSWSALAGSGSGGFETIQYSGVQSPVSITAISGTNSITTTYTNASQSIIGNASPSFVSGLRLIRAG